MLFYVRVILRSARLAYRGAATRQSRLRGVRRDLAAWRDSVWLCVAWRAPTPPDRAGHAGQTPPQCLCGRRKKRVPDRTLGTRPALASQRGRSGACRVPVGGRPPRCDGARGWSRGSGAARRTVRAAD